jgi:hypothetical protein
LRYSSRYWLTQCWRHSVPHIVELGVSIVIHAEVGVLAIGAMHAVRGGRPAYVWGRSRRVQPIASK